MRALRRVRVVLEWMLVVGICSHAHADDRVGNPRPSADESMVDGPVADIRPGYVDALFPFPVQPMRPDARHAIARSLSGGLND